MPLMARVPIMKRIMALSVLGVVEGFAGQTLRLALPRKEEGA